jgi:tetratricopeptide (TPR) repeat protein
MLATSYYNFAKFYMKISDYGNALNYFNKTIRIDEQLGDVETIGIANYNIAQIYNSLALKTESTSKKQDFYQKALTPAQKAYKIGIDNNFLEVK